MLTHPVQTRTGPRCRRSRGVGLVEVLVTMVIITIGLLGVAGLQMAALNNSYAAFQRNLATMQAQDLVERLWAGVCGIGNATTRSTIVSEWQAAQAGSGTNRVAMTNWAGSLTPMGTAYEIVITWTNDRINKSSDTTLNTQTVRQVVQIPTITCV